jgi:hypothetical protein
MTAVAKNLAAIQAAIVQHNGNCGEPITEIRMNPFEVERLGWDDFQGIPIKPDDKLPTGRFTLVCSGQHGKSPAEAQTVSEKPKVGEMVPV